jgi:perosamine synthetase
MAKEIKQPYQILEKQYAKFTGSKYAITCNTGTAALHLAFMAIGLKPDDEVIMGDFNMAACGFAVSYCGGVPVFVDCDDTLCMDWKLIESKINKKTKAILMTHIYGRLCNVKEILRIAKKHHLKVIEDACEAQGAVYNSKADITCYSFYENKIIHAEEGGICTTDDKKYAEKIAYLKNMAFDKDHTYFHKDIGYNYRMPNSQAKLALESLKNYPKENKRRRKLEKDFYGKNFLDAVWVLPFIGVPRIDREYRLFFKPLSSMPMWGGKCQSPKALHYSKLGHYIKI